MEKFNCAHYFPLTFQGNIYTMVPIQMNDSPIKLLVASLKREIYYIEYQETSSGMVPVSREIPFTYIPSVAEIISLDIFNKSSSKNEFVVGVTIIKNSNNNMNAFEFYLNIYSEWEESEVFNIENIAQNCLTVELGFTPYQLTHTYLLVWENDQIVTKEIVFFLSGSDNLIHIYREYAVDHLYKEIESKDYFPEISKTPSPVVFMDIYYTEDYSERYLVLGCECGYVRLTKTCVKTNKQIFCFSIKLHNFVSKVCLYFDKDKPKIPDPLKASSSNTENSLNLLVVNTILPAIVFEDILSYGLSNYTSLPRRELTNVLTCCQVADIDFDGQKEIVIGNSAQEMMLYKKDPVKGWCLEEIKLFASPLINIQYVDVFGDGVKGLAVFLTKGLQFLQHDFGFVQTRLSENIKYLVSQRGCGQKCFKMSQED